MTATRYTHRTNLDELGRYIRHPALSAPTMAALAFNTLVARWAGTNFTNPVPLVDRRDLEVGDIVYSSFGRYGRIERIHKSESPTSQDLYGRPHLNRTVQFWLEGGHTEASEGNIPAALQRCHRRHLRAGGRHGS